MALFFLRIKFKNIKKLPLNLCYGDLPGMKDQEKDNV